MDRVRWAVRKMTLENTTQTRYGTTGLVLVPSASTTRVYCSMCAETSAGSADTSMTLIDRHDLAH